MPKKPATIPITDPETELRKLQVKRSIENTDVYNNRIAELKAVLDMFNWGIKYY